MNIKIFTIQLREVLSLVSKVRFPRSIAMIVAAMFHLAVSWPSLGQQAATWTIWQTTLGSSRQRANPYADVELQVTYTSPTGEQYHGFGFWDGGDKFRLRFMFPSTGNWRWRTICSDRTDRGLHGRTGVVHVRRYASNNPLYRHGSLKVSPNRRYLIHADDTPFLWIGDTAWLAYVRATDAEWDRYVEDRSQRGFSVLLTSVSVTGGTTDDQDPEGNAPFLRRNAQLWNPAFWRNFEAKVQSANDQGLVMVLTGIGFGRMKNAAPRDVLTFARNLAARLAGNPVVYSPRQDWGAGHEEMLEEIGYEIHRAAPFALVTQHPRRVVGEGATEPMPEQVLHHYYHLESVDFVGVQTGPGAVPDHAPITRMEASRATIEWITALYEAEPHKPVVNLEGVYDDDFPHDAPGIATEMARRGAYLSFLSGACGFTSSSYGLWMWGKGPPFGRWRGPPPSVASAMDRPYATQLSYVADFFRSIEWWRLKPRQDLVKSQSDDWTRKIVAAASPRGDLAVVYLPDNTDARIDMSSLVTPMSGRWYFPSVNTWRRIESEISAPIVRQFTPPSGTKEALLVLEANYSADDGSP